VPIPAGVETVTVTDGGVPLTGPDGTPLEGHFTVTGPDLATVKEDDYLFGGLARRWVSAGRFDPLTLVSTDATGIDPTGFTYTVVFTPRYGTAWTRYISLPKASPSVVLADIVIPDPVAGSYSVLVDPSTAGGGAHADSHATGGSDPLTPTAIGAEPAGTSSASVAAHASATDPHGDRTYADSKLAKASNLADLPSVSTARGNLGLGGAAVLSVGTGPGTVAAGDDARIAGAFPATGGTVSGHLAVTGNALGQAIPATHGVAAWCYDPALAVNSTQLSNGVLYLTRVDIAADAPVTKIYWWVGNQGSSPVAGQNEVGLYHPNGTRLAATNVDSAISSAGLKITVISNQALTAGSFCWAGWVINASVPPTLTRASGWTGVGTAANLGLAPAAYRFAVNGAGRTSLPASITPSSNVGTDFAGPWVAVGS
jgi:hypothetical protein